MGFYSLTINAPLILDLTNTTYDIGSDGIIVTINTAMESGYKISTLTATGIAIDNIKAIPDIQFETLGVNISCNIYHVEQLNQKIVNITGPTGFTPINISLNKAGKDYFYYYQEYPIVGDYYYFIWANDTIGNSNKSKTYNFSIIPDDIPPIIHNINISPNPQYVNYSVNITCDVFDNVMVDQVKINIIDPLSNELNVTMSGDENYFYNTTFAINGNYTFYIWAIDIFGNSNKSSTHIFTIIRDTIPPTIKDIYAIPNPQNVDSFVNISCNVTDNTEIDTVKINISGPIGFISVNQTMINANNDIYYYNNSYTIEGTYNYFIWANDTSGNNNLSSIYSFEIINQSIIYIDLEFNLGWNLITIPLTNEYMASTLAENIYSRWSSII
jgi:hypothetical protein